MRFTVAAVATVVAVAGAAGCASSGPAPPVPQPHWLTGAACTVAGVVPDADGLVSTGLRDAGYRLLVVESCAASAQRDAVAGALARRGLTLVTALPERAEVVSLTAGADANRLRTQLTDALMAARPWVLGGSPTGLSPQVRAVVGNTEVIGLARDERAAIGGTVRDDEEAVVRARAVGIKGLIVSLTNRRDEPAQVTVAKTALGLAGQIHAVDAWTGREYASRDGRLGGLVGAGDTLLLQIV